MIKEIYPILDPPERLTNLGPVKKWTAKIAQENYDWVMSVRSARIDNLLKYFGLDFPVEGQEYKFLIQLGDLVAAELCSEPNFRHFEGKIELTAPGLSMAYDLALLIGDLLIRASGGIARWILFRDEPRSTEFNLHALMGRRKDWEHGIISVCLMHARAVATERQTSDIWARAYSNWFSLLMDD